MRMMSPADAAECLGEKYGLTAGRIKRRVRLGEFKHMYVGTRMMIDLDQILEVLEAEADDELLSTDELSDEIGLTPSAIRRGVDEGWLPVHSTEGRHMRFSADEVRDALRRRMDETTD